jgi:hypothetical protein
MTLTDEQIRAQIADLEETAGYFRDPEKGGDVNGVMAAEVGIDLAKEVLELREENKSLAHGAVGATQQIEALQAKVREQIG